MIRRDSKGCLSWLRMPGEASLCLERQGGPVFCLTCAQRGWDSEEDDDGDVEMGDEASVEMAGDCHASGRESASVASTAAVLATTQRRAAGGWISAWGWRCMTIEEWWVSAAMGKSNDAPCLIFPQHCLPFRSRLPSSPVPQSPPTLSFPYNPLSHAPALLVPCSSVTSHPLFPI